MENQTNLVTMTKEQAVEWLRELGTVSVSRNKDELIDRIRGFMKYPKIVEKLKRKAKWSFTFSTSLDPRNIPPPTSNWQVNDDLLPVITESIFTNYTSVKVQGSMGQQEKAYQMFQSRKIVSVKSFLVPDTVEIYVQAAIKKTYGTESRPATLLFKNGAPTSANCLCPVGSSGLCCHTLALLLFLKHFAATKEKILALTCTQQLQKWLSFDSDGPITGTETNVGKKKENNKTSRSKKSILQTRYFHHRSGIIQSA